MRLFFKHDTLRDRDRHAGNYLVDISNIYKSLPWHIPSRSGHYLNTFKQVKELKKLIIKPVKEKKLINKQTNKKRMETLPNI